MRSWIRCALISVTMAMLLGSSAALAVNTACQADLNGDGVVNFGDLAIMKSDFFKACTPVCGDGFVEPGEECDDGNTVNGDGCSSTCKREPAHQLLATGQTICWDSTGNVIACRDPRPVCRIATSGCFHTGQDGDLQKGAALAYVDNGDGTITDKNTGLMWEKLAQDGSIHDFAATYNWDDSFAVKVATLNGGGGFAGHSDWRLPNRRELESIVTLQDSQPSVSPAFNMDCVAGCTVTTCSCTQSASYWSSSTFGFNPFRAWTVIFSFGDFSAPNKTFNNHVRAVRGGN